MLKLALVLTLTASAQPRCRDGKAPTFTGRPFDPVTCAAEAPAAEVALSSATLPAFDPKKKSVGTLDELVGKWSGTVVYDGDRFEVKVTVAKQGKGYKIDFESSEYRFLTKHVLTAALKGGFWGSKGRYDAVVKTLELPSASREASVFVGAPATADPDGYAREVVVVYEGRADSHRLRFKLDQGVLRYRYDYAGAQPATTSGELQPAKR